MDIVKQEFVWWKNKIALLRNANLDNDQVRLSFETVNYSNYCSLVPETTESKRIRSESAVSIVQYIRSVKEKNKQAARAAILKGLREFRDRLPPEEQDKIKLEEI